jgi:hypothetical protein
MVCKLSYPEPKGTGTTGHRSGLSHDIIFLKNCSNELDYTSGIKVVCRQK